MANFSGGPGHRRADFSRSRTALFVDYETLGRGMTLSGGKPDGGDVAGRLMDIAREEGRVIHACAYADWTDPDLDPRAFRRQQFETRLTANRQNAADGSGRAWITMAMDMVETIFQEPRIDVYVIAGLCPDLEDVLRRLRRNDRRIVLVASGASCPQEVVQVADRFYRAEDVLGLCGPEGEAPIDFENYDWTPFVRAIECHEKRMEFIGIGLLLKKILDHRNCGYSSYNRKREIFEKAKERGVIEIYTVPNIEEGADPVSACRLCRDSGVVRAAIESAEAEEAQQPADRLVPGEGERVQQ